MRGGFKPVFDDEQPATPKQRQEFARTIRMIADLMDKPIMFGDETDEEMSVKRRRHRDKWLQQRRRLAPLLKGLKRMTKRYPELAKDFKQELKEIGL